jgi:histone acetyltransferase MYST1
MTPAATASTPQRGAFVQASENKDASLRDVQNIVLGDMLFRTWYPSFYPEEIMGKELERLYVCRWCFKYSKEVVPFLAHTKRCIHREDGPPGRPIYAKPPHSIYEIDGDENKLFAQNLSLFAKLFLDNKSVFFDVVGFNYYLLMHDPTPEAPFMYPVGFFSKEKMSWDNNNLACILVFPPWQRQGLGKILMGVSYELSRRESQIGGPEKPLSELGRRGYLRFWEQRVAREVISLRSKSSISVEELSMRCSMLVDDVVSALKGMGLCEVRKKGDGITISKSRVREWATKKAMDLSPPIDEDAFLDPWEPDEPSED